LSLAAFTSETRAVLSATAGDPVALIAVSHAAPIAISYAATYPDRVSSLVLLAPVIDYERRLGLQRAVEAATPEHAADVFGRTINPDVLQENVEPLTKVNRTNAQRWSKLGLRDDMQNAQAAWNVGDLLPELRCPSLVVHYPNQAFSDGPNVAGQIVDARMTVREGAHSPFAGPDVEDLFTLVTAFILEHGQGVDHEAVGTTPLVGSSGLRILLFTDLESSTELTRSLGDEKAQEILRGHNDAVRGALAAHDGTEVKHTGDGIFASFSSAVSAVAAALQIQRDLANSEVRVRVGLNAGEPIAEDDDYFGLSVIKAARIADRADPGQVLVSNVVRELCEGKRFTFTSIGEINLKGFDEAVALFTVELG
jgi:class 3 adenylate cyclase